MKNYNFSYQTADIKVPDLEVRCVQLPCILTGFECVTFIIENGCLIINIIAPSNFYDPIKDNLKATIKLFLKDYDVKESLRRMSCMRTKPIR